MSEGTSDDLALLRETLGEAGRVAQRFWRADPRAWLKAGSSPVSEADLAVDAFLREALLGARPAYGWVSEETAGQAPLAGETRFFVVDPIDGTRAFLRGEPTWCVSVAVIENGRPVAGVLQAPALGEVFEAGRSGPPLRNGEPIAIRAEGRANAITLSVPDGMRRRLDAARATEGLAFARSVPSLAYRLAMVADGRLDGTIVGPNASDWDIAAADLLLERAGGRLTGLDGAFHLYKPEPARHGVLVAGAPHALARLTDLGRIGA